MANNKMDQAGIKPGVVLLTGGPSRMEFIKETCETIFPESRCFRDTEPELTIARGLARWGRVYIRTESFVREVNEVINRDLDSIEIDEHNEDEKKRSKYLIICLIILIVMMLPSTLAFLAIF